MYIANPYHFLAALHSIDQKFAYFSLQNYLDFNQIVFDKQQLDQTF
jgi:hypothetical protein